MKPDEFLQLYITPALTWMGWKYNSRNARRMLLAVALQESDLTERFQIGKNGPLPHLARGFWQFEKCGGVRGVLRHPSTHWLKGYLTALGYTDHSEDNIHHAIAFDATLACVMARSLLWTHPGDIPSARAPAYRFYDDCWRPGKKRPDAWERNWAIADSYFGIS